MKRMKLLAAIAAILLLTAFFFFFPASYFRAETQQDTLEIRAISLPNETQKATLLTGEALFSALETVDRSNAILYESRDLKPRRTYIAAIQAILQEAFSEHPRFHAMMHDEIELLENLSVERQPTIQRYCAVMIGRENELINVSLILYRNSDFEICFTEDSNIPVFFYLTGDFAETFLYFGEPKMMSEVRLYFKGIGLTSAVWEDSFYDALYTDKGYIAIIGSSAFYWTFYGEFGKNDLIEAESD